MNIRAALAPVVAAVPYQMGTGLYHGTKGWENLTADEMFLSNGTIGVFLDEPITYRYDNLINLREGYRISLLIFGKTELDFTPDQHEVVVEKCRLFARGFIAVCRDTPDFIAEISDINVLEFYNMFDVCTSGVALTALVYPRPTNPVC